MHWVTTLAIYFTVWWTVLFVVLPWGAQAPAEVEPGMAASAPAKPRLMLKFAITSVLALIITLALWLVAESGLVSFREMAREGGPFR
jgi:predicted secreted protein